MDRILIRGGKRLEGRIPISGAKNAALTLLPCALLTDEPLTLRNLPRLADVDSFGHLLNQLGVSTMVEGAKADEFGRVMTLRAANISSTIAPYDIVRKMRASILVLGPLLARTGEATVSLPGGCAIGTRPVDLHLRAMEALGAEIEIAAGYVKAKAPGGKLRGGTISFPFVSVGATENALMAAVLAEGTTIIENAAREPEITDLAKCLIAMGARIEGLRTDTLTVEGVKRLHGATYSVMPDRI
jgi:UDP-N-acetylglucosamine 1-carboxyvinyltransferase